MRGNLPAWEWITLIGVICGAGVSVTVFAFNTFEAQGAANEVKKELRYDMRRVENKVDALLLKQGINPRLFEVNEEP